MQALKAKKVKDASWFLAENMSPEAVTQFASS
jgi:hypothetical protein